MVINIYIIPAPGASAISRVRWRGVAGWFWVIPAKAPARGR
jgi:hypothetical protein